jgi:hypothetical protein
MAEYTYQKLDWATATCSECPARCDSKNALAWAHNHARKTGHSGIIVCLQSFVGKKK